MRERNETPEERAIQDKRVALRRRDEAAAAVSAQKRKDEEPEIIFDPRVGSFVSHRSQDFPPVGASARFIGVLFFLAIEWAVITAFYAMQTFSLFGNCGPQGFLGQDGTWEGGAYSSVPTAAALGGVLWLIFAVVAWRFSRDWPFVLIGYAVIYSAALFALWYWASAAIWGHQHCVIS